MNAVLVGLALAVSAPALKDRPKNPDLVGEWIVESTTINGTTRAPGGEELVYEFTKDGLWIIRRGDKEMASPNRGYTIDSKASPPHVDLMTNTARPDTTRREGIFKVEGNTATLCVAAAREPRPTTFESSIGNRDTIYVLKRKKR
jgi:uncharacterized protein (TIGR03067 family)